MINKVFPRKLNSSKDTRLHAQDEMLDAVNITINENNREFATEEETASGNFGVVKPVIGNKAVGKGGSYTLGAGSKVIGSCNDERAGRIYYFVYSPTATQSGVYYYETSSNTVKKLLTSNLFNFRGNSFVDGNIVYVANADTSVGATDLKPILFFTDNETEPKKIDIQRVSEASIGVTFLDFVSVCPRTPIDPPVWTFQSDPSRKVSNFRGERGFQFAYQNIYKSGDVSALSTYSTLAVPSAYLNQGTTTNPNFFAENLISIQITSDAFTSEVARVRVLARGGNEGSWFVIDEADVTNPTSTFQSDFYNDQIYTVLPEAESQKQFDSVPTKARTQDVTNNRLFYANYAEGFDVPNVNANITHAFQTRPEDFISVNIDLKPELRQVNFPEDYEGTGDDVFINGTHVSSINASPNNRVCVYKLVSDELPTTIQANTQIIFNISLAPDKNFHFYESRDSFHASAELKQMLDPSDGNQTHVVTERSHQGKFADMSNEETVGIAPSGAGFFNGQTPDGFKVIEAGAQNDFKREGITTSPFGLFNGDNNAFPRWQSMQGGEPLRVVYGTSPQNPFILYSNPCAFSGSLVTLFDLDKPTLIAIIRDMLSNKTSEDSALFEDQDVNGNTVAVQLVDIVSLENRFTYNIDLNIQNKEKLKVYGNKDYRADLVVAVGDHISLVGSDTRQVPPCGYFIVNKATPTVGLRDVSPFFALSDYGEENNAFLALDLIDIINFDVVTCVPDVDMGTRFTDSPSAYLGNKIFGNGNYFEGWVCFTTSFINSATGIQTLGSTELGATNGVAGLFKHNGQEIKDIIDEGTFTFREGNNGPEILYPSFIPDPSLGSYSYNFYGSISQQITGSPNGNLASRNVPQISRWIGYLIPTGAFVQTVGFGAVTTITVNGGKLIYTFENFADEYLSDVDSTGIVNIKNIAANYYKYAFTMVDGEGGATGSIYGASGNINKTVLTHSNITMGFGSWLQPDVQSGFAYGNIDFSGDNNNLHLIESGFIADLDSWRDSIDDPTNPIFAKQKSLVEISSFDAAVIEAYGSGGSNKSFKTKATHDFGIVFYDQRGRSSDVVPIGSHYVTGYDESSDQGPVQIQIGLTGSPPSWAWHYQIVYGGNNTYEEFVQYTSGGAFVEQDAESESGNIYVSLNYLQNSIISYAESFGAVNEDGSKDLYTFKEGDKLRILSYYENDESRVYPSSYEFDIVGVKNFADDEDNVLINQENPPAIPSKVGEFLILRDNPLATGFSYSFVKAAQTGGTSPSSTAVHLWNNRCVVEIYRPLDSKDNENRVYYEISKKYNVIRNAVDQSISYENNNIVLSNGDVYFRRTAVNMPLYDESSSRFLNILKDSGSSQSRFRDYYLESSTFTDTFSGANQYDFGKIKIANRFQKEIRRDSSITFSDVQRLADPILRYTSFDATQSNFKDLPNKHGQISKIVDYGDALFILNEDKISAIPIARSVISDLAGQDFVIASEKVMGTQKFYAGDNGCSTNPESVVKVGENLYFANKERQEVYRFNPSSGVAIISELGMKSYFRQLFKSAIDSALTSGQVRVVGGYDPILDEYILTVYNATTLTFTGDTVVDQDVGTVVSDPPIAPDDTGTGDEEGGGVEPTDDTEINDLQDQINVLGGIVDTLTEGIEDVIGDTGATDPSALTDQLDTFINDLDTSIEENEELIISQLINASVSHTQLRDSLSNAINDMTNFQLVLTESFDDGGEAELESQETLPVPQTANAFSNQYPTGTQLTPQEYSDFLQLYIDQANNLVDLYLDVNGSYLRRGGEEFTDYVIAYGVPTSDGIPSESAIAQNPDFIIETTSFRAEMNGVLATSGSASIEEFVEQLGFAEEALGASGQETAELLADKQLLLNQISQVITAIYETKGPEQGGSTPMTTARLFGANYGGLSPSILDDLYDAVQSGDQALLDKLEEYSSNLESLVQQNLEDGIQFYKDDEFEPVITSLTATRDALATFVFQSLNAIYNLSGEPDSFTSLPTDFTNLFTDNLTAQGVSSQAIIDALDTDGDGNISMNEIVYASALTTEFQDDLDALYGAEVALNELRGPVTDFLEDVNEVLDEFNLPIDLTGVENLNEGQFINLINSFSESVGRNSSFISIAGAGAVGGANLLDRLKTLKGFLEEISFQWYSRNGLQGIGGPTVVTAQQLAGSSNSEYAAVFQSAMEDPSTEAQLNVLRLLYESVEAADDSIRQWQRWLGQFYEDLEVSQIGTFLNGFTSDNQEGAEGFNGVSPSDYLDASGIGVSLNTDINRTALGNGGSHLSGVVRAMEILNERAFENTFFPVFGGPNSEYLTFNNFTTTNTLADFVGNPLYQEAVGEIEAAYQAALDEQVPEEDEDD